MKRDPDLIRAILLAVENGDHGEIVRVPDIAGHSRAAVHFHTHLLIEAAYLHTALPDRNPKQEQLILRLSWVGYDFLDRVRDDAVWRTTKAGAKKLGSWSIDTLAGIAKAAILAKASSLGIDMATA